MLLSGAEILIEELIRLGVTEVFGYPGGAVLNIYDELYKHADRIHHCISAHEQGAAHAADGYARVTGRTGVVIATSGPGATNIVTGLANAYLDSVPMVAITGNVTTPLLGKDSFQEVDIVGITLPVVKHNFVVKDVRDLENVIKKAFYIAGADRPGPVLIDIPKDVQINKTEYFGNARKDPPPSPAIDAGAVSRAAELVAASKFPFIYCGGGAVISGASDEVMELSKKLDCPVGLSMMGITALPWDYEMNLGLTGMHGTYTAVKSEEMCDLIIAVGVRFSDRATGDKKDFVKGRRIIHLDIDNAEIDKNIKTDCSVIGDLKETLTLLTGEINGRQNPEWHSKIAGFRAEQAKQNPPTDKTTHTNVLNMLNSYTSEDTIVATDVGQHQLWTIQDWHFCRPRTLLTSGGLGTMGYGLGAAIGGCLAGGKKKTVLVTGDGSFGMNLNELATAVTQDLPIVVLIMDNGVLGMVRQWQRAFYGGRFSHTTLGRKTDFAMLAAAFGAEGFRVNDLAELKACLDAHYNDEGPVVIDCAIDMDENVLPMIPPGGSFKDIITS